MKLNKSYARAIPNATSHVRTGAVPGGEGADLREVTDSIFNAVENYSRKNPTVVTVAIFMAGFYVGWKVKPW